MATHEDRRASTVLVAGGTGFIGGIITRALLADGHHVIVPSRAADRLAALAAATIADPGILTTLHVDADHPHREAARRLREQGQRADGVVAAIGGWSIGRELIELTEPEWDDALRDHLTSHLEAVQAYVPLLDGASDPVYITLNGAAATTPMVGSGAISVTGAAQQMLTAVLRAESVGRRVRFHQLGLMAAVAGDRRNLDPATEITAAQVAGAVRRLLSDPTSDAFVDVGADGA